MAKRSARVAEPHSLEDAQSASITNLEVDTTPESPWKWNHPQGNILRLASTYWCFFLLGCNDSSYGFLITHLESFYHVQYATVSLLFLSPVAGFIFSTFCNYSMHMWVGQRGIAIIAGFCHLVAYSVGCAHPPYPVLVAVYILVGLGNGAKVAAWNSFVGGLENPNELLGLLHGFYGTGATLTPSVGSVLVAKRGWKWYELYYLFIGMAVLDMVFSVASFRSWSGQAFRNRSALLSPESRACSPQPASGTAMSRFKCRAKSLRARARHSKTLQCLKSKTVLLCSAYLLAYVGCEVALGGWIVTFMIRVRHGTLLKSGIVASGFWAGITVGRMTLGFVTGRFFRGEKYAVAVYLIMAIILELLFWLIPSFVASAVTVAFLGFFLGPLFPGVIVCLQKLLPKNLHLVSIGVVSAIGASGASVVPFMIGAIAQAEGVRVLQPVVLAFLCLCFIIWVSLPDFRH